MTRDGVLRGLCAFSGNHEGQALQIDEDHLYCSSPEYEYKYRYRVLTDDWWEVEKPVESPWTKKTPREFIKSFKDQGIFITIMKTNSRIVKQPSSDFLV